MSLVTGRLPVVVSALYRRYRPESFSELIGQSHVTAPLQHALRSDRVNHAYLFSGPRGCGKTTSARILARCLNCVDGPTDTPCGVCPSCIELSREGGGSLDVVEIDAASHNGVDDARDLRERAVFAAARDRYKIFILDEAHMVTQQGFNALLKIVEEPPEHVKFIFATTEPEKVIGTIRSRTHHYPFRLVPPSELVSYIEGLCAQEGVSVESGVLSLVVRAGGGSVRDTLSILDQLIAGSADNHVTYDRAVALLGYTHGELLAEVVSALQNSDGAATFLALEKVLQTGQDPRRFTEDVLEYVRDLIVVEQARDSASALLPGVSEGALEQMKRLAGAIGTPRLSAVADVAHHALSGMSGATSPKLHLELLMARLLVAGGSSRSSSAPLSASAEQPPSPEKPKQESPQVDAVPAEPLTLEGLVAAWPGVLESLASKKRVVWTALTNTEVVGLTDDVVTIGFPVLSAADVLKKPQGPGLPVNAELVREAIQEVTGHRVRFKVAEIATPEAPADTKPDEKPEETHTASWPVVSLPNAEPIEAGPKDQEESGQAEESSEEPPTPTAPLSQIGEAVIREFLGGQLVEEHVVEDSGDR